MAIRYQPKGIHTANMPATEGGEERFRPAWLHPFITLSPQAGAECAPFLDRLLDALNDRDTGARRWKVWDRNLIARVSDATRIPAELLESLEKSRHTLVDDFFVGLTGGVEEVAAIHQLRHAARELAEAGYAVLIGHGSVFMTHDLPGGLHIRLVAPMRFRIKAVAEQLHLPPLQAGRHIRHFDKRQRAFFARYWPAMPLAAEMFAATLNVAELDAEALVQTILAMLPRHPAPAERGPARW